MILHINEAKYLTADLFELLHRPVFDPLKDKNLFAQLRVDTELSTIVRPNGADLAPESVYFRAFKDVPGLQEQF